MKEAIYHRAIKIWIFIGFLWWLMKLCKWTFEFCSAIWMIYWRINNPSIRCFPSQQAYVRMNYKTGWWYFEMGMSIGFHEPNVPRKCPFSLSLPQAIALGKCNIGLGYRHDQSSASIFSFWVSKWPHLDPVIRQSHSSCHWEIALWSLVLSSNLFLL